MNEVVCESARAFLEIREIVDIVALSTEKSSRTRLYNRHVAHLGEEKKASYSTRRSVPYEAEGCVEATTRSSAPLVIHV